MNTYRTNGAIGALLDEYERSILELIKLIEPINHQALTTVVDPMTDDPDCRSIQTILTHVLRAGYNYAVSIRNHLGDSKAIPERKTLPSASEYALALQDMMDYTETTFSDIPNAIIEQTSEKDKILTSWNQRYDIEQLMEHAIVHILRHRRQIERFLLKMA